MCLGTAARRVSSNGGSACIIDHGQLGLTHMHASHTAQVVKDAYGRPVLLFRNEYALSQVVAEKAEALGELSPYALPPDS